MVAVLVTGGRTYSNRAELFSLLDSIHAADTISLLIQGGATGADEIGAEWATLNGVGCVTEKPAWSSYQFNPGTVRNTAMLDKWHPDLVVAAPGGSGTSNMLLQATRRKIPIKRTWDK